MVPSSQLAMASGPAGGYHGDVQTLRQQPALGVHVALQHQRHESVPLRIGCLPGGQGRQPAGHRLDGGRLVVVPDDARAKGRRLGGHAVFHPEARYPGHLREAPDQVQVGIQPGIGQQEVVESVQRGMARQPRAVHDEGHRHAAGAAAGGHGGEAVPCCCTTHRACLRLYRCAAPGSLNRGSLAGADTGLGGRPPDRRVGRSGKEGGCGTPQPPPRVKRCTGDGPTPTGWSAPDRDG